MLQPIELPDLTIPSSQLPDRVAQLLHESDSRIEQFIHREGRRIHGFVASDYVAAYNTLNWILKHNLLAGGVFCEWGCGFGVVTMLAALAGMDACGIEVEADLVERAEALAELLDIPCQFSVGSLIPNGGEQLIEFVEDVAHIETDAPDGYEALDLELDDFDLVYVYPWPGEERFLEDVFDHYAADGALLLTFHGLEDMRLQRKKG